MNTYSGNYETPLEKTQVAQNCITLRGNNEK